MSGKEIKLNIGGEQFAIKKEAQYDTKNNEGIKKVLTIFDKNHDGKISKEEFEDAKQFTSGIFGLNKDGKSVTYNEYNNGNLNYTSTWKYDEEGRIYEQNKLEDSNGDGDLNWNETRHFDTKDNLVKKEIDYDNDGKIDNMFEQNYDDAGNLKYDRDTHYMEDETLIVQNNYDEKGNCVSNFHDNDGDGNWNTVSHVEGDKVIEEQYDNDGNHLGTFIFNEENAPSKFTWKSPAGEVINLNWTKEQDGRTMQDEKGNLYKLTETNLVVPLKNNEVE